MKLHQRFWFVVGVFVFVGIAEVISVYRSGGATQLRSSVVVWSIATIGVALLNLCLRKYRRIVNRGDQESQEQGQVVLSIVRHENDIGFALFGLGAVTACYLRWHLLGMVIALAAVVAVYFLYAKSRIRKMQQPLDHPK